MKAPKTVILSLMLLLCFSLFNAKHTFANELNDVVVSSDLNENMKITDFSGSARDGVSLPNDVSIKSIVVPSEPTESWFRNLFNPILSRFFHFTFNQKGVTTYPDEVDQYNSLLHHAKTLLSMIVAPTIGLVFFWWGLRKVSRAIMTAFKRGKLRI